MLQHLKMFWKLILIAILTPIAVIAVAGIAIDRTGALKYEYDNLYGFMLMPIVDLDQGKLHLETMNTGLIQLTGTDLTTDDRAAVIKNIQTEDEAFQTIIEKYETQWQTSLSPDFTASLTRLGEIGLQTDEQQALKDFKTAYTEFSKLRDDLLGGEKIAFETISPKLDAMRSAFDKLVQINMRFAELSNESAQNTIQQMRTIVLGAGIILSLVAFFLAWLMSRSITGPLALTLKGTQLLAVGDAKVTGLDRKAIRQIQSRRDEIGDLTRALGQLTNYFTSGADVSEKIASGDLSVDVKPLSERDLLGNAFRKMVLELRDLVRQISENARQVDQASTQLAQSAQQTGDASNQIAATIQQVARGAAQQTESVTRTATSVEQMSRAIDGVAKGAQEQAAAVGKASNITAQISEAIQLVTTGAKEGASDASQAAVTARSGVQTVQETIRGMQSIQAKVGLSAQKVQEMGERSDQIGQIVETIDDIASQTNLLALNAAIEAARAGEHGKGFAVVADEVRKLAERSSVATKEIGKLIRDIQHTVGEAVQAMQESSTEVETGVTRANQSSQALESILAAVEEVTQRVEGIAFAAEEIGVSSNELVSAMDSVSAVVEENTAATEEMAAGSSEVSQAIESIASVSEENSAAVEEVSAGAEELSAQVEEVTAAAHSLAELAEVLEKLVSRFTLDDTLGGSPNRSALDLLESPSIRPNGHRSIPALISKN
ncbi:MAG TPA: methyl-accepting chemotaxis protein [Anaerolineaceae bacterium]|nr:methyl-accepting chemotaxis protein [Anaerolineaceae bacterium]